MKIPPAVPHPHFFSSPYFFFSNNQQSEVLYVSPSIKNILGFEPDEIVGRKYLEFLEPANPLNADVDSCRALRFAGDGSHDRFRIVRSRDQQLKILRVQTYGGKDAEGKVTINYGIAQDVTETYPLKLELQNKLFALKAIHAKLSERERTVLQDVSRGKLNKIVAQELEISERAVERIRSRLVQKFGVSSVAEVVVKATEFNLLNSIAGVLGLENQTEEERSEKRSAK